MCSQYLDEIIIPIKYLWGRQFEHELWDDGCKDEEWDKTFFVAFSVPGRTLDHFFFEKSVISCTNSIPEMNKTKEDWSWLTHETSDYKGKHFPRF